MLRSVKYEGFDEYPLLRERVEGVMPLVEDELRRDAGRISLRWVMRAPDPRHLAVELVLTDAKYGTASKAFDPDEIGTNAAVVRSGARDIHLKVLRAFSDEIIRGWEREDAEPAGV